MKKQYTLFFVLIGLLGVYGVFTYGKNYIQDTSLPVIASSTPIAIPKIIPVATIYTGDWKTCRNEKYGYEFKYPTHWIVSNLCSTSKSINLTSTSTTIINNQRLCMPEINIYFTPNEEIYEFSTSSRVVDDQHILNGRDVSFVKEYIVDGKRLFVRESSREYPCQPVNPMIVAHNNGLLSFRTEGIEDYLLEGILSTFKFVK